MATYGTFNDGVTLTAAEANDIGVWNLAATPVIRQPSSVLVFGGSSSYINYTKINKLIFVNCRIQVNGTGTSNNRIEVDIPVTAAAGSAQVVGSGFFYNPTASDGYRIQVVQYSTTRFTFLTNDATATTNYLGMSGGTNIALAVGSQIWFQAVYEAA